MWNDSKWDIFCVEEYKVVEYRWYTPSSRARDQHALQTVTTPCVGKALTETSFHIAQKDAILQ